MFIFCLIFCPNIRVRLKHIFRFKIIIRILLPLFLSQFTGPYRLFYLILRLLLLLIQFHFLLTYSYTICFHLRKLFMILCNCFALPVMQHLLFTTITAAIIVCNCVLQLHPGNYTNLPEKFATVSSPLSMQPVSPCNPAFTWNSAPLRSEITSGGRRHDAGEQFLDKTDKWVRDSGISGRNVDYFMCLA